MKIEYQVAKGKVELAQGSITRYQADALVCPANGDLEMVAFPGGVQYAFLADGGPEIFKEAQKVGAKYCLSNGANDNVGMVPEFSAHLTGAGKLAAKHVIHSVAVGLEEKKGGLYCNGEVIGISTRNVLDLAKKHNLKSVGFPAFGTGLYGVPLDEAVESMAKEFKSHLQDSTSVEKIGLVLYSPAQYARGKETLDKMLR